MVHICEECNCGDEYCQEGCSDRSGAERMIERNEYCPLPLMIYKSLLRTVNSETIRKREQEGGGNRDIWCEIGGGKPRIHVCENLLVVRKMYIHTQSC